MWWYVRVSDVETLFHAPVASPPPNTGRVQIRVKGPKRKSTRQNRTEQGRAQQG